MKIVDLRKQELASTLKELIIATENKEISTSEQFLNRLIDELQTKKIINLENN